ncbi:MAG: hypothetical protein ACRCTJ_04765 [Brevinema sp.]
MIRIIAILLFCLTACVVSPDFQSAVKVGDSVNLSRSLDVPSKIVQHFSFYKTMNSCFIKTVDNTHLVFYIETIGNNPKYLPVPEFYFRNLQSKISLFAPGTVSKQTPLIFGYEDSKRISLSFNSQKVMFYVKEIKDELVWFQEIDTDQRVGHLALFTGTTPYQLSDLYQTFPDLNKMDSKIKDKIKDIVMGFSITHDPTGVKSYYYFFDVTSN